MLTSEVNFEHTQTVHCKEGQNLKTEGHWEKQGPCQILESWNLLETFTSKPLEKGGLLMP